jgi:hypothetical protein
LPGRFPFGAKADDLKPPPLRNKTSALKDALAPPFEILRSPERFRALKRGFRFSERDSAKASWAKKSRFTAPSGRTKSLP